MSAEERKALGHLNPLDQAAIIEKRLGGTQGLQRAIQELFTWDFYALPHALLAALPLNEAVTTNYDQLFEMAWQTQGRKVSVLPYRLLPDADSWVLKMHGSVTHPEDIVLTREDQIGYHEQHAALAGIVQTLLITRHMLFVGFSLSDDTFHRIVNAVRRVVHRGHPDEEEVPAFGTVLVLERSSLIEELWGPDLCWIGMREPGEAPVARPRGDDALEAARRLEVFLDYLLAQIRDEAHLLDRRYAAVLTNEERALRGALTGFADRLPTDARRAPAWERVERLLRRLGYAPG